MIISSRCLLESVEYDDALCVVYLFVPLLASEAWPFSSMNQICACHIWYFTSALEVFR